MKLQMNSMRINKCVFENNMDPGKKIDIRITTNNQIKLPKVFTQGSIGFVNTKIMVGSPLEPIYLLLEQVTGFVDVEATSETHENHETMLSLFRTICVPMALETMENTLSQLCKAYNIPAIKLQKNPAAQKNDNGFLN